MLARRVVGIAFWAVGPALVDIDGSAANARPEDPWLAARIEALPIEAVGTGEAELSLVVLERPEADMPVSIRLRSEEVSLSENRLGWADVVDAKAAQPRFRTWIALPSRPGRKVIDAEISYVVCSGRWCREKRGHAAWELVVDSRRAQSPR